MYHPVRLPQFKLIPPTVNIDCSFFSVHRFETMNDENSVVAPDPCASRPHNSPCVERYSNKEEHFDGSIKIIDVDNFEFRTFEDFVQAIEQGALDLEKYDMKDYARVQIRARVTNKKVEILNNEPQAVFDRFCVVHKSIPATPDCTQDLADALLERYKVTMDEQTEGSGWSFYSLDEVRIYFYRKERFLKTYDGCKASSWPAGVPGKHHIVDIKTDKDCVKFSLIAHIMNQNGLLPTELYWRSNPRTYMEYENLLKNTFTFPDLKTKTNETGDVNMESFDIIEEKTGMNINLYQIRGRKSSKTLEEDVESDIDWDGEGNITNDRYVISGEGKTRKKKKTDIAYSIKLLRLGKNRNVGNERTVSLCQIEEESHVVLIKDWQLFAKCIRAGSYSKEKLENGKFCPCCISHIKNSLYDNHFEQCTALDPVSELVLPKPGACYKFSAFEATELAPFVAYYDIEASLIPDRNGSKIVKRHCILSYMYIIVDTKGTIVREKLKTGGENLSEDLVNSLMNDFRKLMEEEKKKWNSEPVLTKSEVKDYLSKKKCMFCDAEFGSKNRFGTDVQKVRHHRWNTSVEYDNFKNVVKSNYIGAACQACNLRISLKRATLPVYAHNAGKYDHKFVLHGIKDNLSSPNILARGGENIIQILVGERGGKETYKLAFRDSINFLKGSLDNLSSSLTESGYSLNILDTFLKDQCGLSSTAVEMCKRKGVFPYDYITDESVLNDTKLPSKSEFYNTLKDKEVSDEDYEFAQTLFKEARCSTLKDYLELYLRVDVLLLAEVMQNFRGVIYKEYGLDPAHMITTPSLAMQAALYHNKLSLQLIHDMDTQTLFENSIRGGFTSVVKKHVEVNSEYNNNYDKEKSISSAVFLDVNSLYPTVMCNKLPYGECRELSEDEVASFAIDSVNTDGDKCYACLVDYCIPDNVKEETDDLPLSIHHKIVTENDVSDYTKNLMKELNSKLPKQKTLVADHSPQNSHLISLVFLQLLMSLGLQVTKIRRIFEFKQDFIFKSFIEKNINLRKNAENYWTKNLFKLMSNAIYGKTLFNPRKNELKTKLINSKERYEKVMTNPLLHSCYSIDQDSVIMKFHASRIVLKHPLYIGWFILEHSKAFMYNYFYKELKPIYKKDVSLVYMDTDSFLLHFKNREFMHEVAKEPFKSTLDTSNFDPTDEHYSERFKGVLGKVKSETGSIGIVDIVCLQPKNYSIYLNNKNTKAASKGVPLCKQNELTHEIYKQIYNGEMKTKKVTINSVRSTKLKIVTEKFEKLSLTNKEKKRFWISGNKSYGYDFPVERMETFDPDISRVNVPSSKKQNIKRVFKERGECSGSVGFNLNAKKLKKIENNFI